MGCCNRFIWSFPEVYADHAVYSSNSSWQSGLHVGHFLISTAFSSAIWIITESIHGFSKKDIALIVRMPQMKAHSSISMPDEDKSCIFQNIMYLTIQSKSYLKFKTKSLTHDILKKKITVQGFPCWCTEKSQVRPKMSDNLIYLGLVKMWLHTHP